VVAGREDVARSGGVDILILRDVAEFCHDCRRHEHGAGREQILERIWIRLGVVRPVGARYGEADQRARVGDDGPQSRAAHRPAVSSVSTAVASPS
jgi:hypothetical protein